MNMSRQYRMTARAEAVAAMRERIVDAAVLLYTERDFADVELAAVAERAGTTVQTLLRHFGSKAGLLDGAIAHRSRRVVDERADVPVGDVGAIAAYLRRHYEDDGDGVLLLLAAERRSAVAADVAENGRRLHREWVARQFAGGLERLPTAARRRRLELLVAATDVYTWKILRRDGDLDADEYERAVRELLTSIQGAP
jgi:AcrR family transcriptional regulator